MKRILVFLVAVGALAGGRASAQITSGGLQKVVHSTAFKGSGTNIDPLDLTHACSDGQALEWNASQQKWVCAVPNPISGLTTNHLVKATSSTSVGDSVGIDNGTSLTVGSHFTITEATGDTAVADSTTSGTGVNVQAVGITRSGVATRSNTTTPTYNDGLSSIVTSTAGGTCSGAPSEGGCGTVNRAIYASASNGDFTFSGYFDSGRFQVNGPATFSGSTLTAGTGAWFVNGLIADSLITTSSGPLTLQPPNFQNVTIGTAASSGNINLNAVTSTFNSGGTGFAASVDSVDVLGTGTFNTTSSARASTGVYSSVTSTKSAGSNTLTNKAGEFNASGGDVNIAIQTDSGDVVLNGTTSVAATKTGNGFTSTFTETATTATADNNHAAVYAKDHGTVDVAGGLQNVYGGFFLTDAIGTVSHNLSSQSGVYGEADGDATVPLSVGVAGYANGATSNFGLIGDHDGAGYAVGTRGDIGMFANYPLSISSTPTIHLYSATGNASFAGTITNSSTVTTGGRVDIGSAGAVSYSGLTNRGVFNYDTTNHNAVVAAQYTSGTSHVLIATSNSGTAATVLDVGPTGVTVTGTSALNGDVTVAPSSGTPVTVTEVANQDGIYLTNTQTGQTTDGWGVDSQLSGSYNTTGGTKQPSAFGCVVTSTRSAGSNPLNNTCYYASATGGTNNYAFYGAAGLLYNSGAATIDGGLTLGNTGLSINSQGATNDLPAVVSYHGNPNTHVTANAGSLALDGLNHAAWINTNSSTAWTQLTVGGVLPTTLPNPYAGRGTDGTVTFDGSAVVCGVTPSSNIYTLTRDCEPDTATVNSGKTIKLAGYRLLVKNSLTHNGTISYDGGNASGKTGGVTATTGNYLLPGTTAGGNGGDGGVGSGGSNAGSAPVEEAGSSAPSCNGTGSAHYQAGSGGSGAFSCGTAGIVGAIGTSSQYGSTQIADLVAGYQRPNNTGTPTRFSGGSGGGGGGSSCSSVGVGQGGGGGGGGGYAVVASTSVSGSGTITAKGGNGATAQTPGSPCVGNGGGGGGGGGGGVIVWVYSTNTSTITTDVTGGTHGNGVNTGNNGGDGGAGVLYKINLSGDGTYVVAAIDVRDPRVLGALAGLYLFGMAWISRRGRRSANDNARDLAA